VGQHFWNDAVGPFPPGTRDNVARGYSSITYDVREAAAECEAMLSMFEERIAQRERNATYDDPSDLDPEQQAELDRYYRSEAHKLRWLARALRSVADLANAPARDPLESSIKVVSIR
jgi:hypothetical protein